MNTPKKFSVVILIGVISIFVLAGCSSSGGDDPPTPSDSSNIIPSFVFKLKLGVQQAAVLMYLE